MTGRKERGGTSGIPKRRLEERAEKGESRYLGERWNSLRATGKSVQNVGGKGKRPMEGQSESVLGSKTNRVHRK